MGYDTQALKPRLREFLGKCGVEINTRKNPPVTQCPSPDHADNDPSAVVYDERLFCPVCSDSWDIFEVAGFLQNISDFKEQLAYVNETLGNASPPEQKKKKQQKNEKKAVSLPLEKARDVYSKAEVQRVADKQKWGTFLKAWAYLGPDGLVAIVDVRFEGEGRKAIISFWFDGENLRAAGCPIRLFNLDRVVNEKDKPILIVEGAKCADAAKVLEGFIPVTWNGGHGKARYADWTPLKNREVYIYPDDDLKKDGKTKKFLHWSKQPGYRAALEIQKALPKAKIIKPVIEARKIKKDGADIVEALEVKKPTELAKYILNSKPMVHEKKERQAAPKAESDLPFKILGTSDDNRAYFIGLFGRQIDAPLAKITKGDLYCLAHVDWWRDAFGYKGKMDWDSALSAITELASVRDFDPNVLRGRGAWREKDGTICYHDGKVTIGDPSEKRLYLRKTQRDIGLADMPAEPELCRAISDTVSEMSFDTLTDSIRIQAWTALAPFAGALPWRPCGMITGSSGSGKTTVIDMFVRPIALPEIFSGGDSTEAGVRQRIKNDSSAIVIEEAETDTKKKRWRREDLFSLMRQSTSDDAPRVAKGTRDGKGMSFSMKSMFLFSAISPEVEHIADDNRIFRVNMKKPEGKWGPLRDRLHKQITLKMCRQIRALVWIKLRDIIALAHHMTNIVQEITKKGTRFSLAESILFSTYLVIWRGQENLTDTDMARLIVEYYTLRPPPDRYDETKEIVDRLLDEKVLVEKPDRETMTLREILTVAFTGEHPTRLVLNVGDRQHLRNVAGRHGLGISNDGNVAIAINHHSVMKIIERGRGYHRVFYRHENLISKSKPVNLAGKTRRCVIVGGLLEPAKGASDESDKIEGY
jgi:hypothetical protein